MQLANLSMEYDPVYDADKGFKVMPSSFHDISDVEFQDNWGRVWYENLDSLLLVYYSTSGDSIPVFFLIKSFLIILTG